MTEPVARSDQLYALTDKACDGALTPQDVARLEQLLQGNPAAQQYYLTHVGLNQWLRWEFARQVQAPMATPPAPFPSIVTELAATPGGPTGYFSSGWSVGYLVAVAVFSIALLVASLVSMSRPVQVAEHATPSAVTPKLVGRITGSVDCKWVHAGEDDPHVKLGKKYELLSGFLEITYDCGARVILQGPVTFQVESASGGYLSFGKVTAKVEKRAERGAARPGGNRTSTATSGRPPGKSLSAGTTLPSGLFTVRTPTAIVTDLGTEFGVVVDQSGTTTSDVFRGKVAMSPLDNDSKKVGPEVVLAVNESARVERGARRVIRISPDDHPAIAMSLVRELPKSTAIVVFNTGVGLKPGSADPHWQLAARSDDPQFKPRPAMVTSNIPGVWAGNESQQSQWISANSASPAMPDKVTYTFRTTFELADASPEKAVVHGWFMADNHVRAIRINGRPVSVPEHDFYGPFDRFHPFTIRSGFVRGTNVLDIEVVNGTPHDNRHLTPMGVRVELRGAAAREWRRPATNHHPVATGESVEAARRGP